MYGWRRETTMRGITQSGVRGEVVYYAPCGKAFKQYPDIIRVSLDYCLVILFERKVLFTIII